MTKQPSPQMLELNIINWYADDALAPSGIQTSEQAHMLASPPSTRYAQDCAHKRPGN